MADWQSIVKKHTPMVWQTAYRLLGNEADAGDCLQETFVSALAVAQREPVRNWAALLRHLATNRGLDCLRARVRRNEHYGTNPEAATAVADNPGPRQMAQEQELRSQLRLALAELPPDQAEAFCLRFLEDMSYRAIARRMQINTNAVGVLLHRARKRLRELLAAVAVEYQR